MYDIYTYIIILYIYYYYITDIIHDLSVPLFQVRPPGPSFKFDPRGILYIFL
jgi:hypothetical protein